MGWLRLDWTSTGLRRETIFVHENVHEGIHEGAHEGAGLGHEFLKHVERTRVLIHLVEPEPCDGSDPVANYFAIRSELVQYGMDLERRPEIVAVSKAELPVAPDVQCQLADKTGSDVFTFSSVTGQGLDRLLKTVLARLDEVNSIDPVAQVREGEPPATPAR